MAKFDLGDVFGAVLGGPASAGRSRRRSSRGSRQDLGRMLATLAGAAIEAMSEARRPPPPREAPPPRGHDPWGQAPPPAPARTRKPAAKPAPLPPARGGSVPATGPRSRPAPQDPWSPAPGIPPQAPAPPAIPAEDAEGLLMLRAMIAAAKADGAVDAEERTRIATQLEAAGLGAAARDAVLAEFSREASAEALAREAADPMLAAQLYAAAVAGAGTIAGAERAWLDRFARALRLDRAAAEAIEHRILGG